MNDFRGLFGRLAAWDCRGTGFLFVLLVLSFHAPGQNPCATTDDAVKKKIVDSVRQTICRDMARFDQKDLVYTPSGWKNRNSYSMLYVVNGAYLYKLDLIPADKVAGFIDEILDVGKIENIVILSKDDVASSMLHGSLVENGIAVITMKKKAKFNPEVAGLKKCKKSGDNFHYHQCNELLTSNLSTLAYNPKTLQSNE